MKTVHHYALLVILVSATCFTITLAETAEKAGPTGQNKIYSDPKRNVTVTVHEDQKLHSIPEGFLGINLSYFNITDEIRQKYDLLSKLKKAGIRSFRYPGGEETSFFHWEYPGVNGYEDIWDPKELHGTAIKRGRFQVTWVSPEKWLTNESFMNFDEFISLCQALGAEPIVGVNLTSGRRHNRIQDGIDEVVRWLRYCKEKGYKVTYWFLDNETWNWESTYVFKMEEYAEDVLRYGRAMKKECPDIKLIANPCSSKSYNYWDGLVKFVSDTAEVLDFIDVHWYWEWGKSSFDLWTEQTPLETGDKWKDPSISRPFGEDIALIKDCFRKAGAPQVGLVVLEWNIGPSKWSQTFNQSLIAIIQAELLMEFAKADVKLTCLWPLLWRSSREVWPEQDFFPSIITQDPPYQQTLTLEMFRLFSSIQGKTLVKTTSSDKQLRTLVATTCKDDRVLLFINKSSLRRRITVSLEKPVSGEISAEMIGLKHQVLRPVVIEKSKGNTIVFYAEPYSFISMQTGYN